MAGTGGRHAGEIVTPGDPGPDDARQPWDLVDQRPAVVVMPLDDDDVRAVVLFARRHGLRVAPQGTGHNAGPPGALEDTDWLSTGAMRGIDIDPARCTARVESGAVWVEVTEVATPHGLFPLAGSSPNVGVVGYTLDGGLSWLGRKHGLAANHVTAIEVSPQTAGSGAPRPETTRTWIPTSAASLSPSTASEMPWPLTTTTRSTTTSPKRQQTPPASTQMTCTPGSASFALPSTPTG